MSQNKFPTPSQYYRKKRPEFFSDSKIVAKAILPREQLAYEISQIAVNVKHDSFENLCIKLAEKLIIPNLIPQVGPTGGGDGKTDSETYPVSNFISERWFISNNEWNKNENWAFAVSAKTDWKPKVLSDVKKIIDTNRGYTKIYFFSNQKISSKKKKDTQDSIRSKFNIELIIFDAEWIIQKVYSNNLLNDVIDSLNLSRIYSEEKIIGSKDIIRIDKLEKLENQINSPNRLHEIDFQLVEDCLESAKISRSLELPKSEVIGKFERSLNFVNKINNIQLKIRIHYQLSWTAIYWYDDYKLFYDQFLIVKDLVQNNPNINNIEFYLNLSNILDSIREFNEGIDFYKIDFEKESIDLISFLNICSENINKQSTSLLTKFYLSFIEIGKNLQDESLISKELVKLKSYFELSKKHLDIPFEKLKDTINVYNEILPNSEEYDSLIDVIAEIESTRTSELISGQTYLNRGVIKLKNNFIKESLVYFGKASRKLAKDETQLDFYYCLMLLSDAYSKLNLYWASYNALVSATNIFSNHWYTTGNLNIKFLNSVEEILKNETIVGRIPILLCWYELYSVLKLHFQQEIDNNSNNEEFLPIDHMTDACLSVRLLNTDFKDFNNLIYLPDILKVNELWLSEDAVLYLTGNEELIELDENKTSLRKTDFPNYFNNYANQPFVEQMAYSTNFLSSKENHFESRILGILIKISFNQNIQLLILAENILAFFESFLATSFEEAFPISENVNINLDIQDLNSNFKIEIISNNQFNIHLNQSIKNKNNEFKNIIDELLPHFISRNYIFKDTKEFLDNLFTKDEAHERLSIINQHYNFLTNIFTDKPKFFLKDWIKDDTSEYNILSSKSPITINKELQRMSKIEENIDFKNITHKQIISETIINTELWDKAKWKGFGFFTTEQIPLGLTLFFENIEYGKKIFEDWINKFGYTDKSETITITIIKGVNANNPYWYKVLISKKTEEQLYSRGQIKTVLSRFHLMEAENSKNLDNLLIEYEKHKKFIFLPSHFDNDFQIKPIMKLGILKTEIKIMNAWEIGENSLERVTITKDDNPIIPEDINDAPILNILKK